MIPPLLVMPSTTSHKREALLPTLDLFARLGFLDLDLNLNHIVEGHCDVEAVRHAVEANSQRVWIVSGGWCDFFDTGVAADRTQASVERQIDLARRFSVDHMRLFFGRLPVEDCTAEAVAACSRNIQWMADRHPDLQFVLENHDGASSRPEVCRAVLECVDRRNVRFTFDPINFEHRGVRTAKALEAMQPLVGHVHLKGYAGGAFCGFGEGDVDLIPALVTLVSGGYRGAFTVEYEGSGDRTLGLFQSVRRARDAIARLSSAASGRA
jgi:sugar phosphate isomerase/epimerase